MKKVKTIEKPVLVYESKEYMNQTRQQLETCRLLMNGLLDIFNKMDIGICSDINELLMHPERIYSRSIDRLAALPETGGKFTLNKAKYLDNLDLPDPTPLYQAAKAVRQQSFCAVPGLWNIKDNRVVLNESEALVYIDSESIYVSNAKHVEFSKDVAEFVKLFNKINDSLNGSFAFQGPATFQFLNQKFTITEAVNNSWQISINPEALKVWLRGLK